MSNLRFDKRDTGYSVVCPARLPILGSVLRHSAERGQSVFISQRIGQEWTASELEATAKVLRQPEVPNES